MWIIYYAFRIIIGCYQVFSFIIHAVATAVMMSLLLLLLFILVCLPSRECVVHFRRKPFLRKETTDNLFTGIINNKIYLGSKAKIPCVGKNDSSEDAAGFKWEHDKTRLSENADYNIDTKGVLTVNAVRPQDTGTFVCTATIEAKIKKWQHDVTVVHLPSASLHISFTYSLGNCSNVTEAKAKAFVEAKLGGKVCIQQECRISLVHSSCHFEELSSPVLRITVPVTLPEAPTSGCDEDCTRRKLSHLERKVKEDVVQSVMDGTGLKIPDEPQMIVTSFDIKLDMMCDPGFQLVEESAVSSICIPCTPGHFLEKGHCIPCHLNQYTDRFAATECKFCDGSKMTNRRGATSKDDCSMASLAALWIFLIILIFPSILCFICCYCLRHVDNTTSPGRCLGTCCRRLCDFRRRSHAPPETPTPKRPSSYAAEHPGSTTEEEAEGTSSSSPTAVYYVTTAGPGRKRATSEMLPGAAPPPLPPRMWASEVRRSPAPWRQESHVATLPSSSSSGDDLMERGVQHRVNLRPDRRTWHENQESFRNHKGHCDHICTMPNGRVRMKPLPSSRGKIQGESAGARGPDWRPCEHDECRLWRHPSYSKTKT